MYQEDSPFSIVRRSTSVLTRAKFCDGRESDVDFWTRSKTTDLDRHILLVRAMLIRAILDATGHRLSGGRYSDAGHNSEVQRWAKAFFRHRHPDPFGWGWTIDILELTEQQAQKIEEHTLKEWTDISDEAA